MTGPGASGHARGRLLRPLPEREIRPGGWIADRMRADLRDGFVGHLDRLAPDLLLDDDIFGRDRLTGAVRAKDLGALSDDTEWTAQFLWWNAETQGNWRDGWVRHCLAVGDEGDRAAAAAWVGHVLAGQDDDGYLGINAPDMRFPERGENGELWGQACLLRALLGYHGATGDAGVLEAVRRAADRIMAGYQAGASHPFGLAASFGGVSHGLMVSDVFWELEDLTGDRRYAAYAAWLYDEFATSPFMREDATAEALLDPGRPFDGHGVHTYEQWRALTVAAAVAAEDERSGGLAGAAAGWAMPDLPLEALEDAYAAKLAAALTPAGAPNGDEQIHARGSAEVTGYELCSVQELLHAYGRRVEATADLALGDRMESLVLNVAMGMRDPVEGGAAYLKTDNSRSMAGVEGFRPPAGGVPQTRYRYSPVHREAAVCCVPNAGRILPTWLRYQWLRGRAAGRPELVLLLYGPSVLRTSVAGVDVVISQETAWPADGRVRLTVDASGPVDFDLVLRVPGWADGVDLTGVQPGRLRTTPTTLRLRGPWGGRSVLEARFRMEPRVEETPAGERLVARGPVLFALPLPGTRRVVRTHDVPRAALPFRDVEVVPDRPAPAWRLPADPRPRSARVPPWTEAARADHAWQRVALAVDMVDERGHAHEGVLVPMGATVLRLVAFPPA